MIARKLNEGEMDFRSRREVTVYKWKSKRDVLMISNAHKSEMVNVSIRHGKLKQKPNMIREYNESMSGIE